MGPHAFAILWPSVQGEIGFTQTGRRIIVGGLCLDKHHWDWNMEFLESSLPGAFIIKPERFEDDRGFFARTYCAKEFAAHGLATQWPQCNVSYNIACHTLRGMHFQAAPYEEDKLVRCTRGAIFDVIIDLRPESPAYLRHVGVELTEDSRHMLYVPKGFAHGFITMADHSEVFYQMSAPFEPGAGRGYRYDDPAFGIAWPAAPAVISERDRTYNLFEGVQE